MTHKFEDYQALAADIGQDPRHVEIMAWLEANAPQTATWFALDDREQWFAPGLSNLDLCLPRTGLDDVTAAALRKRLEMG